MSSTVRLIDNQSEYSRSVDRVDGNRLDICAFRAEHELVIAIVNEDDVHVQEISFSSEELQVLLQHLSDPITIDILGGK